MPLTILQRVADGEAAAVDECLDKYGALVWSLAQRACRMEDDFDRLYIEARERHIERLETGVCHPAADVVFTETMRNLERISDHADNLGISTVRT